MSSAPDSSSLPPSSDDGDLGFNIYGYDPTLAAGIVFMVLFGLITIIQTVFVIRSRVWWLSVILVGGLSQVIGWAGRTWAAVDVYSLNAFLIQQILLILAPCFYSALVYGVLAMVVRALDSNNQYTVLRPRNYLIIFCIADLIAIVVQAVGGAMAALALQNDEESSTGTHIMVAGIVMQLFSMLVFCALAILFYTRALKDPAHKTKVNVAKGNVNLLTFGLAWSSLFILIRCCYRTAELSQGWTGFLITHERFFIALDAAPMVLAQGVFVFTWPTHCLPEHATLSSSKDVKVGAIDEDEKEVQRV